MSRGLLPALVSAVTLLVAPSHALGGTAEALESWSMSALASYIAEHEDRDVDDGYGVHIGAGRMLNGRNAFEIVGNYVQMDKGSTNRAVQQWSAGLDYRYWLGNSSYFRPYALIGAVYASTRNRSVLDRDDDKGVMASAGVGVLTPLSPRFNLRTEVRLRSDQTGRSDLGAVNEFVLSIGVELPLRRRDRTPSDRDGDLVPDADDRCGSTPPGTAVDGYGCAVERPSQR